MFWWRFRKDTIELTEDILLQITGKRGCMILMLVNSVDSRSQTSREITF